MMFKLRVPNPERFVVMRQAFDEGLTVEDLFQLTKVDRWWLEQLKQTWEQQVPTASPPHISSSPLLLASPGDSATYLLCLLDPPDSDLCCAELAQDQEARRPRRG